MGFDQTRFESKITDEFLCPICLDVLNNPVYLPNCEHVYCMECIQNWMTKNKTQTCPMDRIQLDPDKFQQPLRSFCNLLNRLKIRCQFNSCNEYIYLSDLKQHEQYCFHNPDNLNKEIQCSNCDLKIKITEQRHDCLKDLKSIIEKLNKINEQTKINLMEKTEQFKQQQKTIELLKKKNSDLEQMVKKLREEIQAKNDVLEMSNIQNIDHNHTNNSNQQQQQQQISPILLNDCLSQINNDKTSSFSIPTIMNNNMLIVRRRRAPPIPPPKPPRLILSSSLPSTINNNNNEEILIDLDSNNNNNNNNNSQDCQPKSINLNQLINYNNSNQEDSTSLSSSSSSSSSSSTLQQQQPSSSPLPPTTPTQSSSSSSSSSSVFDISHVLQFLNQKITLIDPITNYNQMNNNSKNLNVHRACSLVDRRHFYGTNINIDKSISIMVGKKNSHSFPLKYEIRLLEYIEPFLRKNSRVLDIGSGMGHLTCLLANLCQFVVGIDNVKELVKKSQEIVAKYYQNLQLCFCKTDGRNGCENYSPYDLILIEPIIRTGTVPEKLFRQLKPNGSIIAIVRFTDEYQQLLQQSQQQQQQQQPQLNRFQLVRFIKMNNLQITLEILCNDHDWLVQNHKDCFQ